MTLHEEVDLQTGNHTFTLTIEAREIMMVSEIGRNLPKGLTDSTKLSDKFTILSLTCLAIEEHEHRAKAQREWPL